MLATAYLGLISVILLITSGVLFGKEANGTGMPVGFFGLLLLVFSLWSMDDDARTNRSKGYPTGFSDTTWTAINVLSVDSSTVVRFADLPESGERAVLYEMSAQSFGRNPSETMPVGSIRLVRVVKSPEGFSRIEVK